MRATRTQQHHHHHHRRFAYVFFRSRAFVNFKVYLSVYLGHICVHIVNFFDSMSIYNDRIRELKGQAKKRQQECAFLPNKIIDKRKTRQTEKTDRTYC